MVGLENLLKIIDPSENVRIFVNDTYICDLNLNYADVLLSSYMNRYVDVIETKYSKTLGGEVIGHLCIYVK